jgi:hypothetical protein
LLVLECLGLWHVEILNVAAITCVVRVTVGGVRRWVCKVRREDQPVKIRGSVSYTAEEYD